jgi:hypothetical protein
MSRRVLLQADDGSQHKDISVDRFPDECPYCKKKIKSEFIYGRFHFELVIPRGLCRGDTAEKGKV